MTVQIWGDCPWYGTGSGSDNTTGKSTGTGTGDSTGKSTGAGYISIHCTFVQPVQTRNNWTLIWDIKSCIIFSYHSLFQANALLSQGFVLWSLTKYMFYMVLIFCFHEKLIATLFCLCNI